MRTTPPVPLLCLLFALLFASLFHGQQMGLNLLLFELPVVGLLWWMRRPEPTRELLLTGGGTIVTAILVVLHGSDLARALNVLSLLLFVGVLLAPQLHALNHSMLLGLRHVLPAQRAFLHSLQATRIGRVVPRMGRSTAGTLVAVLLVLALFMVLYQSSNPHFDQVVGRFWAGIEQLFIGIDITFAFTFLLGLSATNIVLQRTPIPRMIGWMEPATDDLLRRRTRGPFQGMLALRYELRTGVLLLGLLNLLLLLVNVLDIRHVWFDFSFNGQYLKQFVHEGTYLLILSILLGAGIVLWFFRANQNFHRSNSILRRLAFLWLAQNMVLAISVGIRNYWYIHHYALAYKRIGVVFFLVAVIIGLFIVGLKVRDKRSRHFLFRWNAFAAYSILLLMAFVNWDVFIARYNFSKQDQSFIHLDFMATLSDKALPWLAQEQHALERIDTYNQRMLDSDSFSRSLYMEPRVYGDVIAERTGRFMDEYPERSWRSWTWADERAYGMLR
ncbi:MAG: DUF4173 domain-containing protein [Flavobacteriales bacterium]